MMETDLANMLVCANNMSEVDYIEKLKEGTGLNHSGSPYHYPNGDPLAMEWEYAEKLMQSVINNKPQEIVEIGTATGYSTSWLALGVFKNGSGNITTFDYENRNPHLRGIPGKVSYVFKEFLKATENLPKKIDFVFHDAQHRYELITADLDAVMPRMSKNSQIFVHDVTGSELPNMMKDYFNKNGYEFTHFKEGHGLGWAKKGDIK